MSFTEILEEIPNLTFAQREEVIRCAIAIDERDLTAEESALLNARIEDFHQRPDAGIAIGELRERIARRLGSQRSSQD